MPLLSLIEDNFNFVKNLGIPSCSLSGSTENNPSIYTQIKQIHFKIVYITPEKLVQSPSFLKLLEGLYVMNKIDRFVIDEVHCVSHWGQDFRKDYLNLNMLK